ncbi:hypothetical protein M378DRAFT_384788 [Amanita muscaria Koide BX008]|uniref:F-box domain-containing protein n=1 Tax=Amanita muscaria (strain Koide BX008) TaxID=946122 RepID=A0A0C2XBV6_AMAMK|nr:hypothetical protein M378DRAFT_384788 [Amanita muscaria Koide BX008]
MELPVAPTTPIMLSLVGKQNQPFTEDELDIIRQSRLEAGESLQHVRTEIKNKEEQLARQVEALQLELSVLESQEHDLIDKIERYSTALSPHNKLPPEILRHIFKCCVDDNEMEEIPVTYKGGAYTISHVCSAWRRIALDTPELWTGISLQLTEENEEQIRVARQWLSRARTLPRSISINQDSDSLDSELDGWGDNIILNLVAHYPLRLLELTLPYTQLEQLKGLLDQSLSTLEVLRLKQYPGDAESEILPLLFRPTDTLSKLNILVLEGDWDLQNLNAVGSWSRIVHLNIEPEISAPQCFIILQQCSQIEICSLYVQDTGAVSTVPDIILPQIHCLWICTGGVTTKLLVDAMTAPKLGSLSFLQTQSPFSNVDTAAFCQMIERCQGLTHLTALCIGATSEPLDPLTLLEKLPHLETMQISNGILDEDTMNRISLGKVGSNLKNMTFESRHGASEILRMVEVRQQNASLNSYWPLARVSPFTEIRFNCISVSSSLEEDLISRKNALENSQDEIYINLTFD